MVFLLTFVNAFIIATSEPPVQFPVPRAESEFRDLMPFVEGWGRNNVGNEPLFIRWTLPYAPLDLRVTKAPHAEAEVLRNMYYGAVARHFEIPPQPLLARWFCGPTCVEYRRSLVADNLPAIRGVVADFRTLRGIDLIAQWGVTNESRVDNVFSIRGQTKATTPSASMGFVPSNSWTPVASIDAYIRERGDDPAVVQRILEQMRAIDLVAVVREGDDIRVVRIGLADNEAGAVFTSKPESLAVGTEMPDGREIAFRIELADGICYYESS